MPYILSVVIGAVISSLILRVFAAIGIGFFTYSGFTFLLDQAFAIIQTTVSGLPIAISQLIALSGAPEALSVIASALAANVALSAARVFVGVK